MQYRLSFVFLLVLVVVSSTMFAAADKVTLIVGGEKVFLHAPPVLVDGAVYVSLPTLNAVGAKYDTDKKRKQDGQEVKITAANGRKFSCRARVVKEELMVPIRDIASDLGAVTDWNERAKVLSIRARVERVEFDGSELRVSTSYPVTHDVTWWKAANKLILDMHGVYMPTDKSELPVSNSTSLTIRWAIQTDGQTGRVVVDMPCPVRYRSKSAPKTSKIVISVSGLPSGPGASVQPPGGQAAPGEKDESKAGPPPQVTQPPPEPPADITDIDYRKRSSRRMEVYVSASRPVEYITLMFRDPDRLVVDVKNATLAEKLDDVPVGHEILQGIRVGERAANVVRLVMDLTRVVGFDVRQDEKPSRLVISLELPKGAGGLLAERTIVIDPGHGGRDPGATGYGGWQEKRSNLAIALRVQKLLSDAGVCALMTRKTDVRLDENKKRDLEKRAEYARRHSADIFLSIHSNSVAGSKCPSGIMTFYHGRETSGRALAYCIHSEVIKAARLPDLAVRSDFSLYQTGLGLLRNAVEKYGIPTILTELGYVKHPGDVAKIKDPKFQQKMAEAIVRGLKAYVEGNPRPIKRAEEVKPEPVEPAAEAQPSAEPPREERPKPAAPTSVTPAKPEATTGPRRPGER